MKKLYVGNIPFPTTEEEIHARLLRNCLDRVPGGLVIDSRYLQDLEEGIAAQRFDCLEDRALAAHALGERHALDQPNPDRVS